MFINDYIKFLEHIKQGFKIKISWNKYRSNMTAQTNNNNSDHLTDTTFRKVNRLFVLSFRNGDDDPTIHSFDQFCMQLVESKILMH